MLPKLVLESAQFRTRFFHISYQEELGSISGHFGPVNAIGFSPDGKGFVTGGEDGYVRLHHFDRSFSTTLSKEALKNKKSSIREDEEDLAVL